ncbi:hypothetical protein [Endozoicomonas ascidiicola]|uniref:hypothetical protein n=1 Tax=Endozoicomonas ascidiicola TaxID=1698521 RepID=UPI000831E5DE|nr:hypothetical protein [Endozoicomonas ascidiicola]
MAMPASAISNPTTPITALHQYAQKTPLEGQAYFGVTVREALDSELIPLPSHTKTDIPSIYGDKSDDKTGIQVRLIKSVGAEGVFNLKDNKTELLINNNPGRCIKYGDNLTPATFYPMTVQTFEMSAPGTLNQESKQITLLTASGDGNYADFGHAINKEKRDAARELLLERAGSGDTPLQYNERNRAFFNSDKKITGPSFNELAQAPLFTDSGEASETNKKLMEILKSYQNEVCGFPNSFAQKSEFLVGDARDAHQITANMQLGFMDYMKQEQDTKVDAMIVSRTSQKGLQVLIDTAEKETNLGALQFRRAVQNGKRYETLDDLDDKKFFTHTAFVDVTEHMKEHGISKPSDDIENTIKRVIDNCLEQDGFENRESKETPKVKPCLVGYSLGGVNFVSQSYLSPPQNNYEVKQQILSKNSEDITQEFQDTVVVTGPVTQKDNKDSPTVIETDKKYHHQPVSGDVQAYPTYYVNSQDRDPFATNVESDVEALKQLAKLPLMVESAKLL